jgi:Na+/H+ antiporter NhaD/arsenite permease-like protein
MLMASPSPHHPSWEVDLIDFMKMVVLYALIMIIFIYCILITLYIIKKIFDDKLEQQLK